MAPISHLYSFTVEKLRAAGCVFAEEETRMLLAAAQTPEEWSGMLNRRAEGMPLEYVIGWVEFCGVRIEVDAGVFIPRPRTEFLLKQALALAKTGAVVVDLCCGTGALGAALAAALERIELHAADIDPASVLNARRNVAAAGGRVYEGDLFDPLPAALRGRVDLIVANTPYVPTGDIDLLPPEARFYESRLALDGGADGLDVQRRVAADGTKWLAPGGHLLVEASERQIPQTMEIFSGCGLISRITRSDEWDAAVVIGTMPVDWGR